MIKVLFFARIREQLGTDQLSVPCEDGQTVYQLRESLICGRDERWRAALCADNVVKAVNHTVVDDDCILHDGDELAFFPPVTGG